MSRKFPLESMTSTEVSPMAIFPSLHLTGQISIMAAREVPASLLRSPLFANASRKEVVVSMSRPAAFILAPQFLYASPSSAAVVELFACAYAIISAK